MPKKLYECRYGVVYYAWANDQYEAGGMIQEVLADDSPAYPQEIVPVTQSNHPIIDGWRRGDCVYGEEDISLGTVLDRLPSREIV